MTVSLIDIRTFREGDRMKIIERSHIGKKRTINQDYIQVFKNKNNQRLAILCDGMGGHLGGEVASKMAVRHFGHAWEHAEIEENRLEDWMFQQIKTENFRIFEKSQKFSDLKEMGTTLVAAAETDTEWKIFNIGDSRAYLFSNHQLIQVSEDHSFVNELVKSGEITKNEAMNHPKRNILTRSLGVDHAADADRYIINKNAGDIIMLCSDGLTDMVSDETIEEVLNKDLDVESKSDVLLEKALEAGGSDNISMILIEDTEKEGKENGNE